MCSTENDARAADDPRPTTVQESALSARDYFTLLSKLKCTTAFVDGRIRRREYLRKYAKTERGKETIRRYTERNRAKRNAYNRMRQARKMGDLVKARYCESCGTDDHRIEAHHDDYAKPLEVRWLCRPCHKTWHRKNGPALNG